MWVSASMETAMNKMWHPQTLHKEILDNVGFPPPTSTLGGGDKQLISDCMHACWEHTLDWQSASLNYLIEHHDYDVIFSHFHSPDLQKHMFIREMKTGRPNLEPKEYEKFMLDVYTQIDRYIGRFLHLLDKGWTFIITSDHAQVCPTHGLRGLGDTGCNVSIMSELGFTTMTTDENGRPTIDWSKTKAVANREMYIYLNLKGRSDHGIVDPADQFELEEKIMTDLYSLKDEETGYRMIQLALRNRDAALLGMGGEQSGDIIYYIAEGFNWDHADSISTIDGWGHTSVRSTFIGAGKGIKQNFVTPRIVHHVDITPTVAALMGLRMPAQAEGAPIYQILDV